jgi:hypothetical protein
MKQILLITSLITFLVSCSEKAEEIGKTELKTVENLVNIEKDTIVTQNSFYNEAFNEITKMLEEKISMDFKRAVFLTENAYSQGNLDYSDFCKELDKTTLKLKSIIKTKGIENFKTAGNYAIYEYMTKPSSYNDFKTCTYDFADFYGESDWEQQFVTKLMRIQKGKCHSLPFYYKILADELNTSAHLAFAPNHIYVKHLGEDNKWVNVELTNGNLSTDAWLISSMGISAEAIQKQIYMEALDLKESIAYCLTDLGGGYIRKFGEDDFAILCFDKTLEYYPNSIHTLMYKSNSLRKLGLKAQKKHGNQSPTAQMKADYEVFQETQQIIESLGYREMPSDKYENWVKSVEAEKAKTTK